MTATRMLAAGAALILLASLGSAAQQAGPGRTDEALIYFYRKSSWTDSILNPTLYSGDRRLARLEKDQFFALPVPPGTHYFSWTDTPGEDEQAWVTVARGQLAFFQVRYRSIQPVEDLQAIEEMQGLDPIENANVYDPAVISTPVIDGP